MKPRSSPVSAAEMRLIFDLRPEKSVLHYRNKHDDTEQNERHCGRHPEIEIANCGGIYPVNEDFGRVARPAVGENQYLRKHLE